MRTVMYYVPNEFEPPNIRIHGGYWEVHGIRREVKRVQNVGYFGPGEKGVMTLEQADLDVLLSYGLVVLGDIPCEL